MSALQLELFESYDEIDILRLQILSINKSCENVRKGLFARHNEICKRYIDLKEENENLRIRLARIENLLLR
jgi:hypothetical protein